MMMYVWIALILLFIVIEAITAQLVTIWSALGSVGALIAYFCGATTLVQWIVFVAVSTVSLVATRPLVKKYIKVKIQPTNADSSIGLEAVVSETIDNLRQEGAVKLRGLEWTARSENGEIIEKDEIVIVRAIEGVKLIVDKKQ